jgi:hypothetical protein
VLWLSVSCLLSILLCEVLWILALDYADYFPDDAYISLRYSQRLLRGLGLTWTDGEWVEGYSNLLWVLLVALGGLLSDNLVIVARVLGIVLLGGVPLALFLAYPLQKRRDVAAPLVASSFLALSGSIQAYSVAGLEQSLLAAELGWLLCLCYPLLEQVEPRLHSWLVPSALLAALVLTRPDGFVLVAGALAGLLLARGLGRASFAIGARLAVAPLLAMAGQFAFRRFYYSDWFPNTYYAKVAFTPARLHAGLNYLLAGYAPNRALLAALLVSLLVSLWNPAARRRLILASTLVAVWLVYVAFVGGDFFPQHRHLVAVICVACVVSAEGVRVLIRESRLQAAAVMALAAVALLQFQRDNRRDPERGNAQNAIFHIAGVDTGRMLRLAFSSQRPLLAVDAAGCMPYHYELPSIDMLGLTDRYLAHHRPKTIGTEVLGHELGDGAYVLSRKPDIVVFSYPQGLLQPMWRGGWEMYNDPRFARDYKLVKFMTKWPHQYDGNFFVRKEGRVGIERRPNEVVVPGHLLYDQGTLAQPNSQNRMVLELEPGKTARLSDFSLPAGHIEVVVDGSEAITTIEWQDSSQTRSLTFDQNRFELDMGAQPVTATLSVRSRTEQRATLTSVRFVSH